MSVSGITTTTGWMAISDIWNHYKIAVSGMETTTGWQYLVYGNHYKIAVSGMVSAEGHT